MKVIVQPARYCDRTLRPHPPPFALAEIANPAVGQRANQCLVSRHDAAEGVAVAGQTARYKLSIAVLLCGHRSVGYHNAGYVPAIVREVTKNITELSQGK